MKNNNKTLKRLTATFLTATSIFNFTVPGKAEVVNFQQGGSIRYGKENNKIISSKELNKIRENIKNYIDVSRLGREYTSTIENYRICNFRAMSFISKKSSENINGRTKYRTDQERIFEYSSIKDVHIICSIDGTIEGYRQENVKNDKKAKCFNQFGPEHEDSIFLVIAPDAEWEKMEEIYKKEDVQNKFIRFGSIYDTGKTLNLDITVGVDDGDNTKKISLKDITLTERKINFIDPTSPKPQQNNYTFNKKEKKKSYLKPILIGCGGILAACLLAIPVVGTAIKWGINKFSNHKKIPKHNI